MHLTRSAISSKCRIDNVYSEYMVIIDIQYGFSKVTAVSECGGPSPEAPEEPPGVQKGKQFMRRVTGVLENFSYGSPQWLKVESL